MASRCVFQGTPCAPNHEHLQSRQGVPWIPIISCPAEFPLELFEIALLQLVHHPEYNSTLILRSETIQETDSDFPPASIIPELHGLIALKNVHRKLLARRPGRDAALEQHCTLYGAPPVDGKQDQSRLPSTLVFTPILDSSGSLPYYHPSVFHIAFRYITSEGDGLGGGSSTRLQIEVVPFPGTPLDLNSRLYRTCLSLLETLHRYGWGAANDYKKRVKHDCLVPREEYQDLYLIMRERHKHVVNDWHESTDPLKHDIGIATYLMLLWKSMYVRSSETESSTLREDLEDESEWRSWPRPPGGFVDLGCGNGLLVHILVSEGYTGYGTDIRARTSWSHYPESTQRNLHISLLNPTTDTPPNLPPGAFLIGNHADELTPWVPVLATICNASGYLNLPCCPWEFDQKYDRSGSLQFPLPSSDFVDTLNLGGDGKNTSSYSMYRIWLARLTSHCGWNVETDVLRIPSTRNWALMGRTKHTDDLVNRARVDEIIARVRGRGIFSTRPPEGKSKDH